MSARSTFIHLAAKAGILFGALYLVIVMLAAIPGHHTHTTPGQQSQHQYHLTNYWNGFLEGFSVDPARPTSLLYRKTADGYELVGAMYTMLKRATEEQLNARVPLSVATWHLHTNLCMPQKGQFRNADWTKFGLKGSIATQEGCDAANGRFQPVIFGWLVHLYPFEDSLDQVFAIHHPRVCARTGP